MLFLIKEFLVSCDHCQHNHDRPRPNNDDNTRT
jgi:hypothetical protein